MATLPFAQYAQVSGQLLVVAADTDADVDKNPDGAVPTGTILLSPKVTGMIRFPAFNQSLFPRPITLELDTEGFLTLDGDREIYVPPTDDEQGNPVDWAWEVSFNVQTAEGVSLPVGAYMVQTPAGVDTDIFNAAPVASGGGILTIQGPPGTGGGGEGGGTDGREVEIRNSGTYIQWRYQGDSTWTNLVALSTLVGPPGADSTVPGPPGADSTVPGPPGADSTVPGPSVELSTSATHIRWRVSGTTTWTNLVLLEDLRGPEGTTIINDSATTSTSQVWSANKVRTELAGKAGATGFNDMHLVTRAEYAALGSGRPATRIYMFKD